MPADKTRNFYKMKKEDYEELLKNNITTEYKKAGAKVIDEIAKDDKKVATKLELEDRLYCTQKRDAYTTLKDHKQQFWNNPKCRVINPCKSELGMVSKQMLVEIISAVKTKSHLQQWKNNDAVISWFKALENKKKLKFIQFDVVSFYPSISPALLENSLTFAASYTKIKKDTKGSMPKRKCPKLCTGR